MQIRFYNSKLSKDAEIVLKIAIEKYNKEKGNMEQITIYENDVDRKISINMKGILNELICNKYISKNSFDTMNSGTTIFLTNEGLDYFNNKENNAIPFAFNITNISGDNNIVTNGNNNTINNNITIDKIDEIIKEIETKNYYNNEELKETIEEIKELLENKNTGSKTWSRISKTLTNLSTAITIAGAPETIIGLTNLINAWIK